MSSAVAPVPQWTRTKGGTPPLGVGRTRFVRRAPTGSDAASTCRHRSHAPRGSVSGGRDCAAGADAITPFAGSVTDSDDGRELALSPPVRCLACGRRVIDLAELVVAEPDRRIRGHLNPGRIAIVTGVIFFFTGLVKFAFHHWELHAFRSFGLPWPSALEIVAGVVETIGGVLLVARRAVAPIAVVLAVTMVVAIITSGIGHGDVIPSLTLAPALLLAALYLLARAMPPDRVGYTDRSKPAHRAGLRRHARRREGDRAHGD